jgi:hypothetical protein
MARATIGELDQFHVVLTSDFQHAVQTKPIMKHLWILGDRHFGHVAMAILAVLPSPQCAPDD